MNSNLGTWCNICGGFDRLSSVRWIQRSFRKFTRTWKYCWKTSTFVRLNNFDFSFNLWSYFIRLANKQDKTRALDELDIVDRLNVEAVVNMNKCPTLVETCTALHMAPLNYCSSVFIDPSIASGFRSVYFYIHNYCRY